MAVGQPPDRSAETLGRAGHRRCMAPAPQTLYFEPATALSGSVIIGSTQAPGASRLGLLLEHLCPTELRIGEPATTAGAVRVRV